MKTPNTVVVLIAHGSRMPEANEEVRILAENLAEKLGQEVIASFLELASPSISEAIDLALQKSAGEIFVLPYFLTQGRHVQEDIPNIIQKKSQAHPNTPIKLLDYLGTHPKLPALLAEIIHTQ